MKILIIGEFSAFAKHLKNGFRLLGNDVTVVQTGDGWKGLGNSEDIMMSTRNPSILGFELRGLNRIKAPYIRYKVKRQIEEKCPSPDIIIVINYIFLSSSLFQCGVPIQYVQRLLNQGSKLIMSICGQEPAVHYRYPEVCAAMGLRKIRENKRHLFLLKSANTIVPTCYSYFDSICHYCQDKGYNVSKITHSVPLPMTVDDNYSITSCEERKIVIFHGVIRPKAKGTPYIKKAMDRIQQEYPDRVECVCEGGLPYDDYVKLFEKVDILIDQTYGNGWGINAAIGAMKGKCVLTCCGKENEEDMRIADIPFVQIIPDELQIYRVLKDLVLNPQKIDEIKKKSRAFIVNDCECSKIADRYIHFVGV